MADFDLFLLNEEYSLPSKAKPLVLNRDYLVVQEFDNWLVRERKPTGQGIFIRWGDEFIPLSWEEALAGYRWPYLGKNRKYRDLHQAKRTAGYLYLYGRDTSDAYFQLDPMIYIEAGSLLDGQYTLLLDRLGQLAIDDRSPVEVPVDSWLPDGLHEAGLWLKTPSIRQAYALLQFKSVFQDNWPNVLRNPAKAAGKTQQSVRLDSRLAQRQPVSARKQAMRPGYGRIVMPVLNELSDTPENRFLVHVLDQIGQQARILAKQLDQRAKYLRSYDPRIPDKEVNARGLWQQGRSTAGQAADELARVVTELGLIDNWAATTRHHPLLSQLQPQATHNPSLKLSRDPAYAAIYSTYRRVFTNDDVLLKLSDLRQALIERAVKPTHEQYELWLFLETYTILVEKFGFRPADGSPSLHLGFRDGTVKLEKGHRYILELRPPNEPSNIYQLTLVYEPPVIYPACIPGKLCYIESVCPDLPCYKPGQGKHFVSPDIVMEVNNQGKTLKFALDAKYRRYASQPTSESDLAKYQVATNFEVDVLGTAKQKYHNGISFDAAFVVHSDPDPSLTYFGEVPFPVFGEVPSRREPHREVAAHLPFCAGHRYGAVYAAPYKTYNLEKLLKLLLMYHAGWYDICWVCHERMKPKQGIGVAGQYYQCQKGHDFWVKSNCVGRKHLLIKMGENSFHQTIPNNEWNCVCPECNVALAPRNPQVIVPPLGLIDGDILF